MKLNKLVRMKLRQEENETAEPVRRFKASGLLDGAEISWKTQ